MAEADSDEAVKLRIKASEMLQIPTSRRLLSIGKRKLSSYFLRRSSTGKRKLSPYFDKKCLPEMVDEGPKSLDRLSKSLDSLSLRSGDESSYILPRISVEMADEGPRPSYFVKNSLTKMVDEGPEPSYFVKNSLAEMVDEDPIRLQNQSCAIRRETVQTRAGEQLVYSSLARLSTLSIGLSSNRGEEPPPPSLRKNSVDSKGQSPLCYFQMPELGARVFVGNVDGIDTITCHMLDQNYHASEFLREFAARSVYQGDCLNELRECRGKLSDWMWAHPSEFSAIQSYIDVILSGTKLFSAFNSSSSLMVGNLGEKTLRGSGSSPIYKDCGGDETIRQPSDVVEQPEDHMPSVQGSWPSYWSSIENRNLLRLSEGSYLMKPKFVKLGDQDLESYILSETHVLQLTRFDDFIILGDEYVFNIIPLHEVIDIVRKNASETVDVIAAQLVKFVMEWWPIFNHPITFIVIFLDHKEILPKENENMAPKDIATLSGLLGPKAISQSIVLRDDKEIAESKEEEIVTLKEEEKVSALGMEDKKDKKKIIMEDDCTVKILVHEPQPNVPQISTVSLEENELGTKSTAISSKLTSVEVQDNSEASSSTVLIEEDDFKNEDFIISHHFTKWIIDGDLQERTLLCFFNIEEKKYEFYFEDHESMGTIIGLGIPHAKVVLEYGGPCVTVFEIPKEDWDVVWAHSNVIPLSIPKGNVLKQETFPNILHCIANAINTDIIVNKANDGGVGENNGKDKLPGNYDNNDKGKGQTHDHDDRRSTGHEDGGSNSPSNNDDNKEMEEKDENDDKKDKRDQDGNDDDKDKRDQNDRKTSNGGKEVQAMVYLQLWPGGVLKEKGTKKEIREIEEEGKEKKKELWEILEDERKEEIKELEEVYEGEKMKKKKYFATLWQFLKRSESDNVVGNQQKLTTTYGVQDGDDESLLNQLKEQIHAQMVFTVTVKDEAGGQLKTIQATIKPVTFQFLSKNKMNYLRRRRFGWFHEKLKVAFGVVDPDAAYLDATSCKVLDSFDIEEISLQGTSNGNSKTTIDAYKAKIGVKYAIIASGEYDRTNGLEAKTTNEVQNSWKINKKVTKGDFFISEDINLNTQQLKYSYHPRSPFIEKVFEEIGEDDRLDMCHLNPICQSQQVSCEGTWHPYNSKNLEKYKLEASRELGMTRIYNMEREIVEEKKQKGVWKVERNLPLCFIQKLEKEVYLNHSMSHLTFSTTGIYRLREMDVQSKPSKLTQGQYNEEPKWPKNNPLVDVKQ